jgi:RimJ/RimL family protein N-acetyltransferase/predicted N-acetyltransferase YhbS
VPDEPDPLIKTARLELRPLEVDDAAEMVSVLADPALHAYTGGTPLDVDALRARFGQLVVGHSGDGREIWHNWVVREALTGQAVGTVQATVTDDGHAAEVAWVIGVPWQRRGFAAEAAAAAVEWLEGRGATSITAFIHPDHSASEGVARSLGLEPTAAVVDGERAWRGSAGGSRRPRIRRLPTAALAGREVERIRVVLAAAFGEGDEAFTDDDWAHAVGGRHFVLEVAGEIVCHAAVVERELHVDGRPVRTGYVEAVATMPGQEGRGHGSLLVGAVSGFVRERYELGALGTGRRHFYERLGWRTWLGPSFVRSPDGLVPTPDDDGYIMVLETPTSPALDITATISSDWRPGDVW